MFFKYAMALVDSGLSMQEVEERVKAFNKEINNPLTDEEIDRSIMVTVAKKY